MLVLGRYMGRNGRIEVVECTWDGTRIYFEEGVRQSQATANGESVFTYVKIMEMFLRPSTRVLMLGCGGGNLATRLTKFGKHTTIVDINPISFVIAQKFFGLPEHITCVVSDFRDFVFDNDDLFDAIAIDVGGPGFSFTDEFDTETCDAIRARLAPGGRIVMNTLVSHDIDPIADRIAARLAGEKLHVWIVDEPGVPDRNAVIACLPEKACNIRHPLKDIMNETHERWSLRRGRLIFQREPNPANTNQYS